VDWTSYVRIVMTSEIHWTEFVVRMVAQNDVGDEYSRLLTLFKADDDKHV
jgi:hypothetical protein